MDTVKEISLLENTNEQLLQQSSKELPHTLMKSLTYDQGKEMSQRKQFTIDTGTSIFY